MTVARVNAVLLMSLLCALYLCGAGKERRTSWIHSLTDEAQVREVLAATPSDRLEGIWSATADGARIAVVAGNVPHEARAFADRLLLVIMRSPRPGIPPGTVMGWCTPSARQGYYDARIFTRCDGMELSSPKRFTLHLTDEAHLSVIPVRDGLEFVPWKLLPYMFRSVLRERHDRGRDLDGMLRLWPVGGTMPLHPRYL